MSRLVGRVLEVKQPERDEFDFFLNRKLLSDMGIRFWHFRSQTPLARDPERLTDMVEKLVNVNPLAPCLRHESGD